MDPGCKGRVRALLRESRENADEGKPENSGENPSETSGMAPLPAVLLGAITGVGGGTLRDVLLGRIPTVLSSGLYAIPALDGATATVVAHELGMPGLAGALVAAGLCFGIRVVGIRYDLNAPTPRAR